MSTDNSLPFCSHGRMLSGRCIVNRRASRRSAAVFISSLSLAWNAGTLTLPPANCNAKKGFPASRARTCHLALDEGFPTRAAVPKTEVAAVLMRAGAACTCERGSLPCSHLHSDNSSSIRSNLLATIAHQNEMTQHHDSRNFFLPGPVGRLE